MAHTSLGSGSPTHLYRQLRVAAHFCFRSLPFSLLLDEGLVKELAPRFETRFLKKSSCGYIEGGVLMAVGFRRPLGPDSASFAASDAACQVSPRLSHAPKLRPPALFVEQEMLSCQTALPETPSAAHAINAVQPS